MAATSVKRPQNEERRKVASRRRPPPYDALLDEIDEVVYAVAVDAGDLLGGRVERVSRQAERLTGHPPDDFYRDPGLWWKLVHPEDREAVSRTTQRLSESRQPVTREYRLLDRRSGEYRWIEDRVLPWLDSNGALLGYFGAARDITERRRLHGMLTGLAPAASALTGTGYLRELVGQLAQILETDHALVGELSPGRLRAHRTACLGAVHQRSLDPRGFRALLARAPQLQA